MRLLLLCVLLSSLFTSLGAQEFHVAINGSDRHPGSKEQPFATLMRARDAIRELKQHGPLAASVTVIIHDGTYYLPETFTLLPQDSGSKNAPIIYRAAEAGKVVLSGGQRVQNQWVKTNGYLWRTTLSQGVFNNNFRQLFVDERSEIRARFPNVDAQPPYLFAGGDKKDSLTLETGKINPAWGSATDAQIHIVPEWRFFNQIQTVIGVDVAQSLIRLGPDEQHARIIKGSWFHIEGVREELDQPREWFYAESERALYYWPEAGHDPNTLTIIAPQLNRIIHFRGDVESDQVVEYVSLHGLTFRHTTYTLGHIEARVHTDAAVMLENASRCTIERCTFHNVGGYGVWLHLNARENRLENNSVSDAGGGGILLTSARFSYLDDSKLYTPGKKAATAAPLRNEILRNHIHHCGKIRYYNSGIHLDSRPIETALAAGNLIAHNHIHHMPRNGIFAFRNQGGNIIAFNRIEDIMRATEDGGGIHFATMNQLAAPNIIRNNLIANVWGWRQKAKGPERHIARGIYLDWFTADCHIENNVVYNTKSGGLQFNAGDDNVFINNVVIGDKTRWDITWMKAKAQGTIDERNLVITDKNAASPLRDAPANDFTLRNDFPHYPKDFRWIDVEQIGLTGKSDRTFTLEQMASVGGVLTWDMTDVVTTNGPWQKDSAKGMWGLYHFHFLTAKKNENASLTFRLPVKQAGFYRVRLNFPANATYASNARVEVEHADGKSTVHVDLRTFGFGPLIGRYRFMPEKNAQVTISTNDADGDIAVEGVGFSLVNDASFNAP
jgi:parallel beta-helix repeat protein